ncbi:unnamed protein product [Arabidopsis thaliana]|uniref:(thale cress) hypothetical protein n=1 Tax=Arabidopsis thaliana TaxID=3702 RepID=A0A7G2EPF3_ARATH|nr:unnamed protein product [Arabidopsis thaliana]
MTKIRMGGVISTIGSGESESVVDRGVEVAVELESVVGDGVEVPPVEAPVGIELVAGGEDCVPSRHRKRRKIDEDEAEIDLDPDYEDDCAVHGDEDCDAYTDAVEEFPEFAGVEEDCSDDDPPDDVWEEDKIPDPFSSDDEDESRTREVHGHRDAANEEVLLELKKTYNTPDDFKLAVLRYSLKTRYDIKLFRSEARIVAAKCSYVDKDGVQCPWKVYCSYEKTMHKMQIRTYVNNHICVRSGHSKMLKRSSIAYLFEERLRVNPKLTKYEMAAEILREYNLEVTPDQCAKAKTKVLKARNASHEAHFARVWDYQAEGLVKAIHTILPHAEHRQCSKHIMDNWKRDSHDLELQRLFWKIARSYTVEEFNNHMMELQQYNRQAHESLQLTSPVTWSRAFFRIGTCCNDNLNNLSESFNRTIRQARRKPILDMLEDIRRQCMVRTAKRFLIAEKLQTRFTKRAHEEIEKMIAGLRQCERYMARENLHEIYVNNVSYFVDMEQKTCGCRKWQMVGIPCIHATCVIIRKKKKGGRLRRIGCLYYHHHGEEAMLGGQVTMLGGKVEMKLQLLQIETRCLGKRES